MNRKMIAYSLGRMLILEGLLLVLPVITGIIYKEYKVALSFASATSDGQNPPYILKKDLFPFPLGGLY